LFALEFRQGHISQHKARCNAIAEDAIAAIGPAGKIRANSATQINSL
jgi:hypothetical protein